MFKSNSAKISIGLIMCLTASSSAFGQDTALNQSIVIPNSSSSFNQNGFSLPSQAFVSGQDVVKSTTGITCQSAIGSSGPKLDMGLIGSNDLYDRESVSVYGRLSVPLGKRPKRVDCTQLYDLEIARLKMELQLMRAGMHPDLMRMTSNQPLTQTSEVEKIEEEESPSPKLVIGASDSAKKEN